MFCKDLQRWVRMAFGIATPTEDKGLVEKEKKNKKMGSLPFQQAVAERLGRLHARYLPQRR